MIIERVLPEYGQPCKFRRSDRRSLRGKRRSLLFYLHDQFPRLPGDVKQGCHPERSRYATESKDLRTFIARTGLLVGRSFDYGLRPPLRMTPLFGRCTLQSSTGQLLLILRVPSPLMQKSHPNGMAFLLATRNGLEPSTSSVTGWRANRLHHRARTIWIITDTFHFVKSYFSFFQYFPDFPAKSASRLPFDCLSRRNLL